MTYWMLDREGAGLGVGGEEGVQGWILLCMFCCELAACEL
jgi:hypothetical protein